MHSKRLSLLCALTALTPRLAAQERAPIVGVGITVPSVGLLLPINVGRRFRIEPYVLLFSSRADYPVSSDTLWDSHTRLGLGTFFVARARESVRVYFGPRFGLLRGSTRLGDASAGRTSTKSTGWFVGGVIGGEYAPAPRLSAGGEAKIEYLHSSSSSSGSGSVSLAPDLFARYWSSGGALVIRFYP